MSDDVTAKESLTEDSSESITSTLQPIDKAAVLLVYLESQVGGITNHVFSHIGEERSKKMLKAIARLGKIDTEVVRGVIEEFYELAIDNKVVFGGKEISEKILKEAFGVSKQDEFFSEKKGLFEFLKTADDTFLIDFMESESIQMAALVMNYLPHERMATLLSRLDQPLAEAITMQLVSLEVPSQRLLWSLQFQLEDKIFGMKDGESSKENEQLVKLARVLELMDNDVRNSVFESIQEKDPETFEQIERMIFTFDDLIGLSDRDLETILYEVQSLKDLAISMKAASPALSDRLRTNLSERVLLMLEEESRLLPDTLDSVAVDEAKRSVVRQARELEKTGKINPLMKSDGTAESPTQEEES